MLSKLPPFNKPNIIDHFIENHATWNEYINQSDHEQNLIIPSPYNEYDFQKAKYDDVRSNAIAK